MSFSALFFALAMAGNSIAWCVDCKLQNEVNRAAVMAMLVAQRLQRRAGVAGGTAKAFQSMGATPSKPDDTRTPMGPMAQMQTAIVRRAGEHDGDMGHRGPTGVE